MKRRMISIDEDKCNGCAQCIPDCPEGALQIIDGKARLLSDLFCDGLGACIKACPVDAMHIEEREAKPYNEYKVMENIVKGGVNVTKAHLEHLKEHGEDKLFNQAIDYLKKHEIVIPELAQKPLACGCPGSMEKDLKKENKGASSQHNISTQSELNNWPIQLKLMNPHSPYLDDSHIVIAADCAAFSYPNFHQKFLKDKILIILCPKLDSDIQSYIDKLEILFREKNIQSITLVHMQVPCCSGIETIVINALTKACKNVMIKDYTISLQGEII